MDTTRDCASTPKIQRDLVDTRRSGCDARHRRRHRRDADRVGESWLKQQQDQQKDKDKKDKQPDNKDDKKDQQKELQDKDGKELLSTGPDKPYIWFPNEFQGISFGLDGRKAGGKCRIHVPKEMNQANPQMPPTDRPTGVPLIMEVDLIAVRNLQPRR